MVTKIKMPRRWDGREIPNPHRYMCNVGHLHPSWKAAVKCNDKYRKATLLKNWAALQSAAKK